MSKCVVLWDKSWVNLTKYYTNGNTMFSNCYLSYQACRTNSFKSLVFPQPYRDGCNNLKRAWQGTASRVYSSAQVLNKAQETPAKLSLLARVKHLVAGILLLIPIINTIAILILRKIGLQRGCRDWLTPPYTRTKNMD